MEWLNKQIKVEVCKKPKKITGTRFASILGLDHWNTPFKTWCAITRTYEEPFIDSKYTIAGKTIEPKIINYLNKVFYFGELKSPSDVYGSDYYKKTWGDFFRSDDKFGGMWDAIHYNEEGKPDFVIEIKTTKRAEDWSKGAPINYALQASLYAYLLHVDDVVMVVSFLEEKDYEKPDLFVPSSQNTIVETFKISERFPDFEAHIDRAIDFWNDHVKTGLSPEFDEKKDADVLKELRKNTVSADVDMGSLLAEADKLKADIDKIKNGKLAGYEKKFDEIKNLIKSNLTGQFRDGDTKVAISSEKLEWSLSKSESTEIDKTALKKDGLLEKYSKIKTTYTLRNKNIEEEMTNG